MKAKYIYRIDDITEDMNWNMFYKYIDLFRRYSIKPLIGVVPNNKDIILKVGNIKREFWEIIKELQDNDVVDIAQHGFEHIYISEGESILKSKYGYNNKSEFSGLNYDEQKSKILKGKEILNKNGLEVKAFMAPGHTFDKTTIKVLKDVGIKNVTDGIGLTPYYIDDVRLFPVQFGKPRSFPFGLITICLHINRATYTDLEDLENHIRNNKDNIISFDEAKKISEKKVLNIIFKKIYLILRYMKKVFVYDRK